MKLIKKILTLGLGLGLVGGALVGVSASKSASEAKATDYETYIPMEAAFFTDWTDAAGSFAGANATFWGENYHFQNLDTFYRGETGEGWTGTLTSRTWKQHTQYIYFQLGGAKNYDVTGDPVHLKIHYGNQFDVFYNDTFVENPMILRGYKIPDAAYSSLKSAGSDFDMYIEILDQQTAGYGFANFGYLHVNQTKAQVGDAMRYYLNHMDLNDREWEVNKRKQILENYYLNDSLKEFFLAPVENVDDEFESNSDFLNHWYFDYQYYNGANWDLHFDRAIGFDSYRPDAATNMPFNNNGGFFRGWYENNELGGFVGGDAARYRFISRPFKISLITGLVSIKMAGTASLHVIDAETRQELVWADLLSYSTSGDQVNLANSSFNTVTMVRHIINLEAYMGRTVQVAIADVSDGGWSALYVDDFDASFAIYPPLLVDKFTQTNNSGTFYGYKIDKYINSTCYNAETNPTGLKYVLESGINQANDSEIINHVDNSTMKAVNDFMQLYYSSLRSPANEFDYSKASEEARVAVVDAYNSLDSAAQFSVNLGKDLIYPTTFETNWWNNELDTSKNVSVALAALVESYSKFTVSFNGNGGTGDMAPVGDVKGSYTLPGNGFTAPEGYQFVGWKVNGTGETLQPGAEIDVAANTELVAQWELIPTSSFTVSFDSNGGSGTMASVAKEDGSSYELPICTFTAPEGKQFSHWLVGSDEYHPGDHITITGDVTVVAQWENIPALTGTVTISGSAVFGETLTVSVSGSNNTGTLLYHWMRNEVDIDGATSTSYTLVEEDIGKAISVLVTSTIQTGNIVSNPTLLVAKAEGPAAPFGVTATACTNESNNDGTLVGVTSEMEYKSETGSWTACEGTTVVGLEPGTYSVRYKETATHQAGAVVQVVVNAYVAPTKYAVTVNNGVADVAIALPGETVHLTANAPEEGYEFDKWVSDDVTFANAKSANTSFVMPEKDVEVTATYKEIHIDPIPTYIVTFDANGGTGTMASLTVNRGEQIVLPECAFVAPEGKQFDYWLISSVKYQPGEKITVVGDTTIKAFWKNAEEAKPQENEDKPGENNSQEETANTPFEKIVKTVESYVKIIVEKIVEFFKNLVQKLQG